LQLSEVAENADQLRLALLRALVSEDHSRQTKMLLGAAKQQHDVHGTEDPK
jgi:hypothetical protein